MKKALILWASALVVVVGISACTTKSTYPDGQEACEGVDCSGHGQCAVVVGDTAVCICDSGYYANGLECQAIIPGQECDGVACSDHGTCVVVNGDPSYPFCICDQGYVNAGDTNCVEGGVGVTCGPGTHEQDGQCVPDDPGEGPCAGVFCSGHGTCVVMGGDTAWCECDPGYMTYDRSIWDDVGGIQCVPERCLSSSDCPQGEVCSFETGQCGPVPPAECGLPPMGGGDAPLDMSCNVTTPNCVNGLTCAAVNLSYDEDTGEWRPTYGYCMTGCDPCAPDCPPGEDCIKLPGVGGFCTPGLQPPGAPCTWDHHRICATGTYCHGFFGCQVSCTPDNQDYANLGGVWNGVSTSADCASDEVCSCTMRGTSGHTFTCMVGQLVGIGESCGNGIYCEYPDVCINDIYGAQYTCNPTLAGCSATDPCPAGIDCFDGFCIKDGVLNYGELCFEDRNCQSWLVCFQERCMPSI